MKTKIIASFILIFSSFTSVVYNQQKAHKKTPLGTTKATTMTSPNLAGLWKLDYENSRFDKFTAAFHTKFENFSSTLIIGVKSGKMEMKEQNSWDWIDKSDKRPSSIEVVRTYFTNNKGEINILDGQSFKTKTKWAGDKLVITHFTDGQFVKVEPYATTELRLEKGDKLTWHFRLLAESKKEEVELKDLETYLVYFRKENGK